MRLADGAGAVGPPRRRRCTSPATTSACTSRSTPSTASYRWGPITQAPSLLSGDGGFPRSIDDLWEHADPEEVRRELPGPDRAGDGLGHRRDPPRAAPHGDHAASGVLRHLPGAGRRVRPARPSAVDDHRRSGRLPVPPPRRRGGRRVPRPLRPRLAGRQPRAGVRGDPRPPARRHGDPRAAGDRHARGPCAVARRARLDRRPRADGRRPHACRGCWPRSAPC